jgi:hypothetical protein
MEPAGWSSGDISVVTPLWMLLAESPPAHLCALYALLILCPPWREANLRGEGGNDVHAGPVEMRQEG